MIKISDAELEVMKIVWQKEEITSNEIIEELSDKNWTNNTVRTLINRLVLKKAIGISNRKGKTYIYTPLIKMDEYKQKRASDFIKQMYEGSIFKMIENLYKYKKISLEQIEEIKVYLENKLQKKK